MRKNAISSSSDGASRPNGRTSISGTRWKGGTGRGAQRRPATPKVKPREAPGKPPLNAGGLAQPGGDLTEFGKQLTLRRDITVEDIRDHPGPAVQKISPAVSNPQTALLLLGPRLI